MQHRMKQYQCDQCDFMASKLRMLKQHIVSAQEAESLFLCGNCGYRALSPHILKVHQSSKHDGVECRCLMCDCTTNWSADLTTHRRKKHMQPWAISTEPQETCRSSYSGGESLNVKVARRPQILGERRPVSKNNKIIKRIDFEMGPSVKFVSPNKGLISKKKIGGQFFSSGK